MKRCPQCNSVFTDEVSYCNNDGASLIAETLALPSEATEEETVMRSEPILIDFSDAEEITRVESNYASSAEGNVVIEKKTPVRNYAIFLVLGLIIGGAIVLFTLLLARGFYQSNDTDLTANATIEQNSDNSASRPENKIVSIEKAVEKHEKKTDADDDDFNGRVITLNAYVRAAPDRNATEVDVLPIDDRIKIIKRENPKSPWYKIECEHGTSGWMHGNTIEFTD